MQLYPTMRFQPIVKLKSPHHFSIIGWEAFYDSDDNERLFNDTNPAFEMSCMASALTIAGQYDHLQNTPIFINLSPRVLVSASEMEFHQLLRIAKQPIILELTEHGLPVPIEQVMPRVQWLKQHGFRLAIDDIGMGMRHWYNLISPDYIKASTTMVKACEHSSIKQAMLLSLVRKSQKLGAQLVVEGIERREEVLTCFRLGIRLAQGYLLGAPDAYESDCTRRRTETV